MLPLLPINSVSVLLVLYTEIPHFRSAAASKINTVGYVPSPIVDVPLIPNMHAFRKAIYQQEALLQNGCS